ncbi:MAG: efflux RND transporter periplasmic adaptor subunit [Rhodospirillales bacterium]|nr:efflux RND transporter periplasmic adaptor subunit [Rhodospirillales bacterium]
MIKNRYLVGAAVTILGVGAAVTWYAVPRDGGTRLTYNTAALDRGTVESSVSATGSVQALVTVDISSQLSGQVSEVAADYNSLVHTGDLLARIDAKIFAAKVAQAEADLAVARAAIVARHANLQKAEAVLKQAVQEAGRQLALVKKGAASQTTFENSLTTKSIAEADLAAARAQLIEAEAMANQRTAALNQTRIDLERADIRSPIDGVVIDRSINLGQTVASSLQAPILFRIAHDLSRIQIEAQVDEADIGSIAAGNPVTFTVDAYPEGAFSGRVEQVRLDGKIQQNVVTYTVVVGADNPVKKLLPGMTATVRVVTGRRENVLRAPNAAVRFRPIPKQVTGGNVNAAVAAARRAALLDGLIRIAGMTTEQADKLRAALAEARAANGAGAGGAATSPGNRSGRGAHLDKLLRSILEPAQIATYETRRKADRAGGIRGRSGVLWVLGDDGLLKPVVIRFGLFDASSTEILSESMMAGDAVIIGIRREAGK